MDAVRFGRALGVGARQAVKTVTAAVDAATAENPSVRRTRTDASDAQTSPRIQPRQSPQIQPKQRKQAPIQLEGTDRTDGRNAAVTSSASAKASPSDAAKIPRRAVPRGGVRQGWRRFVDASWRPFVRLSGVLWLEVTGVFFGIFALFALGHLWALCRELNVTQAIARGDRRLLGAGLMLAVFGYFSGSSFVQARRRERRR
jgi:hypothetical protein